MVTAVTTKSMQEQVTIPLMAGQMMTLSEEKQEMTSFKAIPEMTQSLEAMEKTR